jgi:hypothetical protein
MSDVLKAQHDATRGADAAEHSGRGQRVRMLDRPWIGSWECVLTRPVRPRPVEDIRAALLGVFEREPRHPLFAHLDTSTSRWLPVGPERVEAYCEQVVATMSDVGVGAEDAFLATHAPTGSVTPPFQVRIGGETTAFYASHALGDGSTATALLGALAAADVDELLGLGARAGAGVLLAALRNELPRRRFRYDRPRGAPGATISRVPAPVPAADQRTLVSQVVDNGTMRGLTSWRNRHAPGTATSSLITAAVYRALVHAGVDVDGSGYYGLIDLRRYLRPEDRARPGNLAKSLFVPAHPGDPRMVEATFRAMVDSGWALPSTLYGTALRLVVPGRPGTGAGPGPVSLSVSVMSHLPGVDTMPWTTSVGRRYIGGALTTDGPSINVFAIRLRSHLELVATSRTGWVPADQVAAAMRSLSDPAQVLTR